MTKLTLEIPTVGEKNTVAEPKVDTALKKVEEFLNGKNIETTDNLKKEGIAEESLSKALQEKFTTRLGFVVKKENASFTAETEKSYEQEKEGATCTLPAPTANRIVNLIHIGTGSSKLKTPEGKIFGDFLAEAGVTEVTLTRYQHVCVQADGTNWYIITGEPKRTQEYSVSKVWTKAEAEAGVEPSATRLAYVILRPKATGEITVGFVALTVESGTGTWPVLVPPGQKWKVNVETSSSTLLL